ncbi:MAG TPA: hypothetical protein GXZ76_06530 [Clostridiaceae bacterium]|nr:hypothetical protein [Clostridiaceae bacterium]
MKSLILYRPLYASTEQYARWIQEELSSQLDRIDKLQKYDIKIEKTKVFFLHGVPDYSKLSLKHRSIMWMLVNYLKRKPEKDLPKDGDQLISNYDGKVSFTDRNSIKPLIEYAKEDSAV